MKRLFFLICFVLFSSIVSAQRFTSFSANPSLTVESETLLFTAPEDRKKEGDVIVAKFTEF
jgi:hypothetical protein